MSDTFHGRSRESLIEEIKEHRGRLRLVWMTVNGASSLIFTPEYIMDIMRGIVESRQDDTEADAWANKLTEQMVAGLLAPAKEDMN